MFPCRFLLALILFIFSSQLFAASQTTEYKVKAAMIFKVLKFVNWPNEKNWNDDLKMDICILGLDPFGSAIDAINGKKIRNHTIRVRRFEQMDESIVFCQVLYISTSMRMKLQEIFEILQGRNILTISDMDQFAHEGGIIELVVSANKIGFIINQLSIEKSNLHIASTLLSLASVILDHTKNKDDKDE